MFDNAKRYDSYLADVEIPEPDNLYDQPAKGFGSVGTRGKDDALIHVIGSSVSKRMTRRNMGKHMKVDQNLADRDYTHQSYQRYLKRYLRCVKGVELRAGSGPHNPHAIKVSTLITITAGTK